MPAIVWSSDYSVGVHVVDRDHKLLIDLINQLSEAVEAGQGRETVGSVLNALLDYTVFHFGREEVLMETVGYPDLEKHRQEHQALAAQVVAHRDAFLADPSEVLDAATMDFLAGWLGNHILGRDKAYMPYMEGRAKDLEEADRIYTENLMRELREADIDFI